MKACPLFSTPMGTLFSLLLKKLEDIYKTITGTPGEAQYSEKRSKFLAFAHHVESVGEVKAIVQEYKRKYYDARHVCYAYMLGAEMLDSKANDDGEPSSTAGKPILGQIVSHGLTDILVVVVRYYGGVNLGTGGLIVAYRTAAAAAIERCRVEERCVEENVTFSFPYVMMNSVMKVVKQMQPRILSQEYDNTCAITLSIRRSQAGELKERLENLSFS